MVFVGRYFDQTWSQRLMHKKIAKLTHIHSQTKWHQYSESFWA